MSGFTPGPWVRGSHDEIGVSSEAGAHWFTLVAEGRDCPVALVPGNERHYSDDPETDANARLISASPDLLAVAIMCAELAERHGEQGPLVQAAKAAILKATAPPSQDGEGG